MDDEDRSELFNEIQKFSQRKLKKVETKVKTGLGDDVIEKRTAKGLSSTDTNNNQTKDNLIKQNENRKLDLQVGMVTGGLMIGSNDVATNSKTLNEYGITHILNLAPNETDQFQFADDFNYLEVKIDENVTKLKDVLDKCFDFIEEGQQRGNCFVHCSTAKPGLSRSTTICIAYLIYKDKKNYQDAFNDVKEARAFVKPSDWFTKQLQEYATEQGSKQKEEQVEDKFTAKKRKEIEEEKAMLQKAVNLSSKKNLWNKQVEESQKKQLDDQMQQEKRIANKLRNNQTFGNENQSLNNNNLNNQQISGPRKLTSLMSIFQQKDTQPVQPINKIVLNKAPVKKWAPVSTPHLQRTVKPETKNYDFYSKVKRAKSKDFKRAESLKKSKSKLNNDTSLNNNKIDLNNNERVDINKNNQIPIAPPPPPPLPLIKPTTTTTLNSTKQQPANVATKQQAVNKISNAISNSNNKLVNNNQKPVVAPPPPPPPLPIKATNSSINNKPASINSKSSSPLQSLTNSRTSSPQPPSSTSSRVSSPIPPPPLPNNKPLNNGFTTPNKSKNNPAPITPPPMQNKLDPSKFNKFNKSSEQNSWLNDKCIDYSSKLNQKSNEVVRNIPIKIEPNKPVEINKIITKNNTEPLKIKEEQKEEVIELECEEEEEEVEISDEEESESEEESEEESDEESEEDESEEESEESTSSSSSSEEEETEESEDEELKINNKPAGLTRSSTQEILRLIKSKTTNDAPLQAITEEDEEIDLLLNGLEKEGIENIDWSEFDLTLDEIKGIVDKDN